MRDFTPRVKKPWWAWCCSLAFIYWMTFIPCTIIGYVIGGAQGLVNGFIASIVVFLVLLAVGQGSG